MTKKIISGHWVDVLLVDDRMSEIKIERDHEGWHWRTYVKGRPLGVTKGAFSTREEAEASVREWVERPQLDE
jgi:hypothetical protein